MPAVSWSPSSVSTVSVVGSRLIGTERDAITTPSSSPAATIGSASQWRACGSKGLATTQLPDSWKTSGCAPVTARLQASSSNTSSSRVATPESAGMSSR